MSNPTPSYLRGYESLYAADPHAAALAWFAEARFGLFMHYGLYSLLGRHEWVMYRENIPLAEYEQLAEQFTAERFDAGYITDLALEAGMRYVNLTSRHHDSFCLFDSEVSDYTSVRAAAGRDLIGELAEQCRAKGLGLFTYYSYALDWRHPYFYPRSVFAIQPSLVSRRTHSGVTMSSLAANSIGTVPAASLPGSDCAGAVVFALRAMSCDPSSAN